MLATTVSHLVAEPDINWEALFRETKQQGHIPDRATEIVGPDRAVFQAMYLNLGEVQERLKKDGVSPPLVTLYADVLEVPPGLSWTLESAGLLVYARRLIAGVGARINLDFRKGTSAKLVVFTNTVQGILNTYAVTGTDPFEFPIVEPPPGGGVEIAFRDGKPEQIERTRRDGVPLEIPETMREFFRSEFLYGAVLYDQYEAVTLNMMLWLKDWCGESPDFQDTFYRAASLVALLSAEINAKENGAAFVPYLSKDIYIDLAKAFVEEARDYEAKYLQLDTVKKLTENDIQLAKTLLDNKTYEAEYVKKLLAQAKDNHDNAAAAVEGAAARLDDAHKKAELLQIDFEKVGIPEWEREQIVKAIISLGTAVITFGVGIAGIVAGNPAGGGAAAGAAAQTAESVAQAAKTGSAIKKMAEDLAKVMKELKKAMEALVKVSTLVKEIVVVAGNISKAGSVAKKLSKLDVVTGGADLTATYEWQVYQLNADDALKGPVEKGIGFAKELKLAVNEIAIYGQALAAAQLAQIQAGQEYARVALQVELSKAQQGRLAELVEQLKVGQEPNLAMMQEFYRRYLDSKSALFTAIKGYQAAFRYWALAPSSIRPKIIDSVDALDTGLKDLTSIALDRESALKRFNPPPQPFKRKVVELSDPGLIKELNETGTATFTIPLDAGAFTSTERVRLTTVRIWAQFAEPPAKSVKVRVFSEGNYLDRFKGLSYQFVSKPFRRLFEYAVRKKCIDGPPEWDFPDGYVGCVEVDGKVDDEVKYAYFQPTPFGQWRIQIPAHGELGTIQKVSVALEGSLIDQGTLGRLRAASGGETFQLVNPDQTALFDVPETDWEAIHGRVEAALAVRAIADQVVKTLPNYRDLLRVCERWKSETFPTLVSQAEKVASEAVTATTAYQLVADIAEKVHPTKPLTDGQKRQLHEILDPFAETVERLSDEVASLDAVVIEFVEVNEVTNRRLLEIRGALGPDWTSIAAETADVSRAVNLTRGGWGAVASDLKALAKGSIPLTTAFLLSLDLRVAILGWESLGKQAREFFRREGGS